MLDAVTQAAQPRPARSRPVSPTKVGRTARLFWTLFRRHLPVTGPDDRRGGWIQTYSGGRFWPLDPRTEDVRLTDVAHHLSMRIRFSGACKEPYCVAQHSVLLSNQMSHDPVRAYALLHHDDTETHLPDVATPLKPYLPFWKSVEGAHERAIVLEGFGVDEPALRATKPLDKRIVTDEARCLLNPSEHPWKVRPEPLGLDIEAWPAARAELAYLERHAELVALLRPRVLAMP